MLLHIELGATDAERRTRIGTLIRTGEITLGGYRKDRIYGLLSCASGKRIKVENRVFFRDEVEALSAGYRPCGHCLPEEYRRWKAAKDRSEKGSGKKRELKSKNRSSEEMRPK